jgi:hypothetical protein
MGALKLGVHIGIDEIRSDEFCAMPIIAEERDLLEREMLPGLRSRSAGRDGGATPGAGWERIGSGLADSGRLRSCAALPASALRSPRPQGGR